MYVQVCIIKCQSLIMEYRKVVAHRILGICRCCLSEGRYNDLSSKFLCEGTKTYGDMLVETFDVFITHYSEGPNGLNRLICEECIRRLKDAFQFKNQVRASERKFFDLVEELKTVEYQLELKVEAGSAVEQYILDAAHDNVADDAIITHSEIEHNYGVAAKSTLKKAQKLKPAGPIANNFNKNSQNIVYNEVDTKTCILNDIWMDDNVAQEFEIGQMSNANQIQHRVDKSEDSCPVKTHDTNQLKSADNSITKIGPTKDITLKVYANNINSKVVQAKHTPVVIAKARNTTVVQANNVNSKVVQTKETAPVVLAKDRNAIVVPANNANIKLLNPYNVNAKATPTNNNNKMIQAKNINSEVVLAKGLNIKVVKAADTDIKLIKAKADEKKNKARQHNPNEILQNIIKQNDFVLSKQKEDNPEYTVNNKNQFVVRDKKAKELMSKINKLQDKINQTKVLDIDNVEAKKLKVSHVDDKHDEKQKHVLSIPKQQDFLKKIGRKPQLKFAWPIEQLNSTDKSKKLENTSVKTGEDGDEQLEIGKDLFDKDFNMANLAELLNITDTTQSLTGDYVDDFLNIANDATRNIDDDEADDGFEFDFNADPQVKEKEKGPYEDPDNITQRRNNLKKASDFIFDNSTAIPFGWYNGYITCFYCIKAMFHNISQLREHTEQVHSSCALTYPYSVEIKIDISSLNCKICSASFPNLESFLSHAASEHQLPTAELIIDDVFQYKLSDGEEQTCVECGFHASRLRTLITHMHQHHTKIPRFVCEECGAPFQIKNRLDTHVSTVHKRPSTCKICNKTFVKISKLREHISQEHNIHSLTCPYPDCKVVSKNRYHHKKHVAYHEPQNLLKCSQCSKVFHSKHILSTHFRFNHVGERRFQCNVCGKRYFNKTLLKDHELSHKKQYKCIVCFYSSNHKQSLVSHFTTVHKLELKDSRNITHAIMNNDPQSAMEIFSKIDETKLNRRVESRYECSDCDLVYKRKKSLRLHYQKVHQTGTSKDSCEQSVWWVDDGDAAAVVEVVTEE